MSNFTNDITSLQFYRSLENKSGGPVWDKRFAGNIPNINRTLPIKVDDIVDRNKNKPNNEIKPRDIKTLPKGKSFGRRKPKAKANKNITPLFKW